MFALYFAGVSDVVLSPNPVVHGQVLNVTIYASPISNITSGSADLSVSVFGIKVASITFDLCSQMGLKCPLIANRPIVAQLAYDIPASAPSGITANCEVDITDARGSKLSCFTMDVQIV